MNLALLALLPSALLCLLWAAVNWGPVVAIPAAVLLLTWLAVRWFRTLGASNARIFDHWKP